MAFMTTMGVTRNVFNTILQSGFKNDVERGHDSGRGRPRALSAMAHLGLTLHYLTSSMKQTTLCLIFGVTQGSVSTYLDCGLQALLMSVRMINSAFTISALR